MYSQTDFTVILKYLKQTLIHLMNNNELDECDLTSELLTDIWYELKRDERELKMGNIEKCIQDCYFVEIIYIGVKLSIQDCKKLDIVSDIYMLEHNLLVDLTHLIKLNANEDTEEFFIDCKEKVSFLTRS